LASQRLHLNIEYDESALKGSVTLRLGGTVSDDELWALVNQLLATRGFTTIRGDSGTLSVVKLADAPGLAPTDVEPAEQPGAAGFTTVAARVQYRPAKEVIDAIAMIISKPGGKVQALPGTSLILISDLSSRTDQALRLLAKLDTPDSAVTVERVPVQPLGHRESLSAGSLSPQPRHRHSPRQQQSEHRQSEEPIPRGCKPDSPLPFMPPVRNPIPVADRHDDHRDDGDRQSHPSPPHPHGWPF
jgi:hypothetical protein